MSLEHAHSSNRLILSTHYFLVNFGRKSQILDEVRIRCTYFYPLILLPSWVLVNRFLALHSGRVCYFFDGKRLAAEQSREVAQGLTFSEETLPMT